MHEVFNRVFDNRLIFPPLPTPRRILDCGFGAASWAIDVAEQFPTCEVRPYYPLFAPNSRVLEMGNISGADVEAVPSDAISRP